MNNKTLSKLSYKQLTLNADTLTPIAIFQQMKGTKKFLLESSYHEKKGKYSFIGANPYEEIIGTGNKTTIINHQTGKTTVVNQEALAYLKDNMPNNDLPLPLPFIGGAIGYVGYDAIRQYEQIGKDLEDELNMPDVHLMIYQNIIVYEHHNQSVHLITVNIDEQDEGVLDNRINELKEALLGEMTLTELAIPPIQFEADMTKDEFQQKVIQAKEYIHQGEALQIVLSKRMKAPIDADPFTYYRKLRKVNPSPYMFYIDFGNYLIIGASPESLIQTKGRNIITNPIAGTRKRGQTENEDELLMKDLLSDEKEIAEHKMLVDLSRNDLGQVCKIGSIEVPTYMKVEKYQHVMHIVSEVQGQLKDDLTTIDALISCLPAGTVSGAPKVRAMEIINELETVKRGFYGGGIGYISFNHDLNMALAIRSLVIKDHHAYLQTGAGIVYDSDPKSEFYETLHKAKSLMEVSNNDTAH